MNDLPKGWEWKKLGEICEVRKGTSITKSKIADGNIPVIAGGQQPAYYHNTSNRTGEVITISASGAYAGFVNYFNTPIFASDCTTVQTSADAKVNTRYVYYILKSQQKQVYKLQTGAGQPHVYAKDLVKIEVPVPPLPVQKRIVSILGRAERLRQKRQEANEDTNTVIQSIFYEMFGDLTNNKYPIEKLGDLCVTSSGGTPSRSKREYYTGGIPWVKSGELNKGIIWDTEEKISEDALKNSSSKYVEPNTVLLAMYGATAGKSALLKIKATTNQAVCAITPKNNLLNNLFLLHTLRTMEKFIVSKSIGGGQPNISQGIIRDLDIILPPISLQNKFAMIVEKVESLRQKQSDSTSDINNLFDALMQAAFKGEMAG